MGQLPSHQAPRVSIEAVERALAADDVERALRLVTEQAESFLDLGADVPLEQLEAWLGLLERHAPEDPWLLYYRAWAWSTQRNHTLALITLKRAAQRFTATLPTGSAELVRARFLVAMAEGAISEREGLYEAAREAFDRACQLGGLSDPPSPTADEQRWLAHDPSGFFAFCLQALHMYRELGLVVQTARAYHNLGTRLIDRGEPVAARAFLEQARELRAGTGNRLAMANTLNSLGHAERHLGLADRAIAHLEQAVDRAEGLGHAWLHAYALNNLAEVHRDAGQFDRAREMYAASIAIKQQTENVFGLAHSHASLADLHLMAGDTRAAVAAAERAVKLRLPGPDRLENARLLSCQARARLADGADPRHVADELEELLLDLRALDAKAEMVLASWWHGVALRRAGDMPAAESAQSYARELAATYGLDRFLSAYDRATVGVRESTDVTAEPDSESVTLKAHLFGGLHLAINGATVDVAGWRSRKAGTLLLLLIHARGRLVHREEAIEALWPDAEADRAGKHLNVALTTVRRGLDAVRPAGGRCVQRVGESYRIAPGALEYLDVAEFERLVDVAERYEQRADLAAALKSADAAFELADRGPYLVELPYEEWAVGERDRLRTAALNLRTAVAEWHLALGQPRQAIRRATEVVTSERWREAAWLVLIRAYGQSGDRAAALQALNECRRALAEELGVQPSDPLQELARSLAG